MKNYVQPGNYITVTAPTGGVKGGDFVLIGQLFGVASYDASAGDQAEIMTWGVFDLQKAAGPITTGARLHWDAAAKRVTTTATGNTPIGHAVVDAADAAATVRVRLSI
jgi:predicted RecA/RadA family phage recombinase